MKNRKKLMIIMGAVLAVLIVAGVVIGVSQQKKQKELEEQGIIYQDGAEGVEIWEEDDILSEGENTDAAENDEAGVQGSVLTDENRKELAENKKNSDKAGNHSSGNADSKDNKGNTGDAGNKDNADNKDNTDNTDNTDGSGTSGNKPSKVPAAGKSDYEEYMAMTPEQQQKYFEKFESEQDFFEWYREAKAEYDKNHKGNEISGGSIDIGDYMD